MLKGDRRLYKELDTCRIIKEIKDLKEFKAKQEEPKNPLASLLRGVGRATSKHHLIDMDVDSDDDASLVNKLKHRMKMTVQ